MMGCFKDNRNDRVFGVKWVDLEMTAEVSLPANYRLSVDV